MLTHETKPSDFKNIRGGDYSHIKGWGADADPAYPMKSRTNEEHKATPGSGPNSKIHL